MTQLPFFFEENFPASDNFLLSEKSSRHILQVLRMKQNDQLLLTNGKGELLNVSIINSDKKKTEVKTNSKTFQPKTKPKITIAISLLKSTNRLEWFLEKATEIGVSEIIPFISERTERQHLRYDRMKSILISAMLQSQQVWLPELHDCIQFKELVKHFSAHDKYIAHCIEDDKQTLVDKISIGDQIHSKDKLILIGPEGDFSGQEVDLAIQHNFIPVGLGETRLRTETAGIVAAVLLLNR